MSNFFPTLAGRRGGSPAKGSTPASTGAGGVSCGNHLDKDASC